MRLSRKQLTAISHCASTERLYASVGPVRSGKSVGQTLAHVAFALQHTQDDHGILGVAETSIRRNIINPPGGYLDTFRAFGLRAFMSGVGGAHVHVPLPGRDPLRIYLFGGQDESAAIERLAGATLASLATDELTRIGEPVFDMAWTRLTPEYSKAWANMNPKGLNHWARRKLAKMKRTRTVQFTMLDNPSLSAEDRERLADGLSGHNYRRLILGEWADSAGLIWPHYTRSEAPGSDSVAEWGVGIDWASSGVFAAVLGATCTSTNSVHALAHEIGTSTSTNSARARETIVAELRHDGRTDGVLTDAEHAANFDGWVQGATGGIRPSELYITGDPTTSHGFQKELERRGYHWQDAETDVLAGIQKTGMLLERGDLVLSPDLVHLPAEMGGYQWDPKAAEVGEDRPIKKDDHHCDALRYYAVRGQDPYAIGEIGW